MTALVGAGVVAAAIASAAHSQCMYSVTAIPGPWCNDLFGYPPTFASAVNEAGEVTGGYTSCDIGPSEAFIWTSESGFVTIQRPPGVSSAGAVDISDTGMIVGAYSVADSDIRAYVYQDGVFTELPPLPGSLWSAARAVNAAGQVVGWRSIGGGDYPTFPYNAFIWSAEAGFTDLGVMQGPASSATDITNTGLVVGWTGNGGNISDAFLLEDGQLTLLGPIPGGFTSTANGANNYGVVVGSGRIPLQGAPVGATRAFRWINGRFTTLGTLPDHTRSSAVDVSDNGTIVGLSSDVDDNPNIEHGFIWQNGVMTDLNELVVSDVPVLIKGAGGINERGQITASGQTTFANVGFLLTPIDPPAADVNGDCRVGIHDLLAMLAHWGPCPPIASCFADLDDDGIVGVFDLVTLLESWD